MAKRNYLVEGLSGAGKSSVYEELIRRGYRAISTDRAWAYHADPDTGLPGGPTHHDNFMWDKQKAVSGTRKPGTRIAVCLRKQPLSRPLSALFHEDISTSASTMTPCVAASKSAPMTTGRLAKTESN